MSDDLIFEHTSITSFTEKIIYQAAGVTRDVKIYAPPNPPNSDQQVFIFYVSQDNLKRIETWSQFFGDEPLSKSVSRLVTAGVHYMDKSPAVAVLCELEQRVAELRLSVRREEENLSAVRENVQLLEEKFNKLYVMEDVERLNYLRTEADAQLRNLKDRQNAVATAINKIEQKLRTETPTRELLRIIWLRLTSKLVRK